MSKNSVNSSDVISIGITNQRETVMLWDKDGRVLNKAIVWQDRRTAEFCEELKAKGIESEVTEKLAFYSILIFQQLKPVGC